MREPTCAERVHEHFANRMDEIRELWAVDRGQQDELPRFQRMLEESPGAPDEDTLMGRCADAICADVGVWSEYGLSLDLHLAEVDDDGEESAPAYLAFVLSTGGPHEEFRFYFAPAERGWSAWRVEFWLLDWFDGAPLPVHGADLALLREIFADWNECEVIEAKLAEARA